jgi:hypothetical protein
LLTSTFPFHRPPEVLIFGYAETHYKFRLPWSPLHKPWPEIFLDAPHQALPGKPLIVYLMVKDADLYPVTIHSLNFRAFDSQGAAREYRFEPEKRFHGNFSHLAFPLPLARDGLSGEVWVLGLITAEDGRGRLRVFEGHNFPGLPAEPLRINLLEHPLPYPAGWQAGEMHCHSEFSSDPVEFGAPLEAMQQAADTAGLDFVLCTDHSYDFYYRREKFLETCDPEANFQAYRAQAEDLNARRPHLTTLVPGEEVSCGNSRGENVHLLTFGHPRFLPGLGDGGRRGFRNRPDLTIAETLELLGDTPSFAAHPKARIGWLERKIFRRGEWREEDVHEAVRGLQFWNGHLGRDYRDGKAFWIGQLLRGKRLLPIGANDAHGDFNRNVGVKTPLVSLHQGRNHVFGKVRTLVPSAGRDAHSLQAAFRRDTCVCTDGPFAELTEDANGALRVAAFTSPDYGALRSVSLYGAAAGEARESLLAEWVFEKTDGGPHSFEEKRAFGQGTGYMRAEVVTDKGRRALTSAVFLD